MTSDKTIDDIQLNIGINKSLFSISWPIFIDLGMHFATMIINMAMVGMVSVQSVAELTVGNQVFNLGLVLFNFINIGVCVSCAQSLGNGNMRMVRRIIHMAFGLNILWGISVACMCFFGSGFIVDIMHVPSDIKEASRFYLMILSLCFFAEAMNLGCAQILRAFGCTRDPMYITTTVNLLTICGNYVLLFGAFGAPKMGVAGVAISTVVCRYIALFASIYLVLARTKVRIVPRFIFVFKKKIMLQILNVGLPGAGENLSYQLQFMTMTAVVASFGSISLATHGIYGQMCAMIMLFSISVGMGTEILVAHYAGAMKLDMAYKQLIRSVKIGMLVTACFAVCIPLGVGKIIISIFTDSKEVLAMATPIFFVSMIMEPSRILNIIIINSLRAVGDTRFPVMMAFISMWGVSIPVGTFLGVYLGWGLLGVWIGFCCDEFTRGVCMLIRWRSKAWVKAAKRNYRINFMKHGKKV